MSWLNDEEKQQRWTNFVQSLNPEIDTQTLHAMDELRVVSRIIYHVGEQSLDQSGLSFAQYRVLLHLLFAEEVSDRPNLNPSEISERHGVSRNTMSSLIRNLEKENLVERHLNPQDRRRFNISLTDSGRARVTGYARQHLSTLGKCFTVLTPSEQETLTHLLNKVGEHAKTIRK